MSTVLNDVKVTDVKSHLLAGAKVDFAHNGSEFVYTIEGVRGLEVSPKGYIIDKGDVKYPKQSNDTVYITARKDFAAVNIAYKSLILLLNGFVPKGGLIVDLKDEAKGYRPDNLVIKSKFSKAELSFDTLERIEGVNPVKVKAVSVPTLEEDVDKTVIEPASVYTQKATILEYVAEDGKAFETVEAAAMHQVQVALAKDVAMTVLEYKKELYGVAEQAYLRVIKYDGDKKPYVNFRDVMDNNEGVQERTAKEVVQFKKFAKGQEPIFAHLFSNKNYTQDTANEILEYLALAQDIRVHLEMLSKQAIAQ